MKKAIVIVIILVVGVGLVWLSFFSPQAQERYIKEEIIKANYCEAASDCQMVAESQCPFGCYVHVNKKEATRIGELLNDYENNENNRGYHCAYSCIEFKGVDCINNTCQMAE